jgi:hypothetical protein
VRDGNRIYETHKQQAFFQLAFLLLVLLREKIEQVCNAKQISDPRSHQPNGEVLAEAQAVFVPWREREREVENCAKKD